MKMYLPDRKVVEKVTKIFTGIFAEIGPKLYEELRAAFRDHTLRNFEAIVKSIKDGTLEEFPKNFHEYVSIKEGAPYEARNVSKWTKQAQLASYVKFFEPDYDRAERIAKMNYESAERSFIDKNVGKLAYILGHRLDIDVKTTVAWRGAGVFDGTVTFTLPDATIYATLGLKHVFRTVPRFTPYYQYPMLFRRATIKGKVYNGPSEDELRELLTGEKKKSEEEVRAEMGICPGSRKDVPSEVWAKIGRYMSPSASCTVCGQYVSAQGALFRTHKTPDAAKAEKLAGGMCEMSGAPVPKEVVDAAVKKALSKDLGGMRDYYEKKYREEPFDSYIQMPCPKCGRRLVPDRRGNYKEHKVK